MNKNYNLANTLFTIFVSVALSLIACIGFLAITAERSENVQTASSISQEQSEGKDVSDVQGVAALETREEIIVNIVEKVNPAVVSVVVTKDVPIIERYYEDYGSGNSFFEDFFGGSFGFQRPQYRENGTQEQEIGGGSGFFVSADGFVVTNKHVVDDREANYTILTNDGEKYDAEILAIDPSIDIAILKVTTQEEFTYLTFANSENVRLGQTAIAIGNALAEFRNSVSVGVVSGLARSIVAGSGFGQAENLDNVIQTDTAINPGNSGGPLMNIYGEVIGVNVAVAQGSENIGFALPSNIVERIVTSVKETGEIIRPYLGVRYIPVTEALAQRNNLDVDYGSLIQRGETREDLAVMPGSPADKSGLEENDIILEVDGQKITLEKPLATVLRDKNVGQTITLKVYREGGEITLQTTLEKAPSSL